MIDNRNSFVIKYNSKSVGGYFFDDKSPLKENKNQTVFKCSLLINTSFYFCDKTEKTNNLLIIVYKYN